MTGASADVGGPCWLLEDAVDDGGLWGPRSPGETVVGYPCQADQLGVGHLGRLARTGPAGAERGDDAVGQLDMECGQESVQVGDQGRPQGQTCVNTPILDILRLSVTDQGGRGTP